MKINIKNSIFILVLIFTLLISLSAISAAEIDDVSVNSTDNNILTNNDENNILETFNQGNSDDVLSYPASSSNSYLKFENDDITITEGDSCVIKGTLYTGNSINTDGNFPLEYNNLKTNDLGYIDMRNGIFSLDISSWNLKASSSSYKLTFSAEESGEYIGEFLGGGG